MAGAPHSHHEGCCNASSRAPAAQSLEELDFERGIWAAARDGDVGRVRSLLERGGSCAAGAKDSAGYTPLHYAARSGRGADPQTFGPHPRIHFLK